MCFFLLIRYLKCYNKIPRRKLAMKIFRLPRIILILLSGTLCLIIFSIAMVLMQTSREYENFKERELQYEQRLLLARKEFKAKEDYVNRILNNPESLERLVREKLGYARPDEMIFRFEDSLNR